MPISVDDVAQAAVTSAPVAPNVALPSAATNDTSSAPPRQPEPGRLQEPLTPKDESKAEVPDAVLQLPAFRAVLEGSPPAVSTKGAEADPDLEVLKDNAEQLLYSGFGFYQAKDGQTHVIYNSRFIDGNALKIADEKGKLDTVAAPYSELKNFFVQGLAGETGAAPAPAPAATTAPQPSAPPPAPAAQAKLGTARLASLAPGAPSSGPVPGQGRVLTQILKPTV